MAAQKRPATVKRTPISQSQLAELVGVDPQRFIAIEKRAAGRENGEIGGWFVVTEPEDEMQTTGTFPQLTTKKSGTKKPGRKRCAIAGCLVDHPHR